MHIGSIQIGLSPTLVRCNCLVPVPLSLSNGKNKISFDTYRKWDAKNGLLEVL